MRRGADLGPHHRFQSTWIAPSGGLVRPRLPSSAPCAPSAPSALAARVSAQAAGSGQGLGSAGGVPGPVGCLLSPGLAPVAVAPFPWPGRPPFLACTPLLPQCRLTRESEQARPPCPRCKIYHSQSANVTCQPRSGHQPPRVLANHARASRPACPWRTGDACRVCPCPVRLPLPMHSLHSPFILLNPCSTCPRTPQMPRWTLGPHLAPRAHANFGLASAGRDAPSGPNKPTSSSPRHGEYEPLRASSALPPAPWTGKTSQIRIPAEHGRCFCFWCGSWLAPCADSGPVFCLSPSYFYTQSPLRTRVCALA